MFSTWNTTLVALDKPSEYTKPTYAWPRRRVSLVPTSNTSIKSKVSELNFSSRESHSTKTCRKTSQNISVVNRQLNITASTTYRKPETSPHAGVKTYTDPSHERKKPVFSIPLPPQLLRKKSGEIVKSALKGKENDRPKSMPTSPTKFVHFDAQLEYIKLFMKGGKPQTISNPGSDVEDGTSSDDDFYDQDEEVSLSIRLPNFPPPILCSNSKIVNVGNISLSEDKLDVIGNIQVANLAYRKHVAVRYTFDFWQTVEEISANFKHSTAREHDNYVGVDEFDFSINLEQRISLKLGSPKKTMFFAVKYQVNGEEYWDNNDGMNYHVEFVLSKVRNGSEPWDTHSQLMEINKDQATKTSPFETSDSSYFSPGSPLASLRSASTKNLSSRYDFGASLSALLASEARNNPQPPLEHTQYFDFPTSDQIDQQYDSYNIPSQYATSSSLSQMLNHEYDSYSSVSVESPFGNNSWEEPGYLLNSYDTFSRDYVSNSSSHVTSKPISIGNNPANSHGVNSSRSKNQPFTEVSFGPYSYGVSPPATCIHG